MTTNANNHPAANNADRAKEEFGGELWYNDGDRCFAMMPRTKATKILELCESTELAPNIELTNLGRTQHLSTNAEFWRKLDANSNLLESLRDGHPTIGARADEMLKLQPKGHLGHAQRDEGPRVIG
jgi:hypothetical protein